MGKDSVITEEIENREWNNQENYILALGIREIDNKQGKILEKLGVVKDKVEENSEWIQERSGALNQKVRKEEHWYHTWKIYLALLGVIVSIVLSLISILVG